MTLLFIKVRLSVAGIDKIEKEGSCTTPLVLFTSSPEQFDCSVEELYTLARYGFTFESTNMLPRQVRVVRFVRCPKRNDKLPVDFILSVGKNYELINLK